MLFALYSTYRDSYPDNVFSSMGLMSLIIEESKDASVELLTQLLASVKKDIMPIGKRLGEKVFADSALKLKPYLTQAVKSLDLSLHGYSKVVTSILEGITIVVEHSSDHTLKNQLDIMPIGKRLGEKVFADIALKLKPYLTQAVKSLDLSLHEYSKVVTSILEGTTIVVEHSSDHTLKNQLDDFSKNYKAIRDLKSWASRSPFTRDFSGESKRSMQVRWLVRTVLREVCASAWWQDILVLLARALINDIRSFINGDFVTEQQKKQRQGSKEVIFSHH
nr:neurofilament heavy polypeptide-like isoform X1 [Ipomoea batatas]